MNSKGTESYFLFGLCITCTHSPYMLTFLIMSLSANTEISSYSLSSNKLIVRKLEAKFGWHKIRLALKFLTDRDIRGIICDSEL